MKILLLTDVPPCKEFSGALLTYHLCKSLPSSDEIVCVAVRNKDLSYVQTDKDLSIKTLYLSKPKENMINVLRGRIKIFTFLNELLSEYYYVPKLAKEIINFGREQGADRIWCILQGQTIIRLAQLVSKGLRLPLLTQVWDHPLWWMGHNNIDRYSSKKIIKTYNQVLSMSACCGAASFAMAAQVERENKIPSIPFVSSLPKEYACKPVSFPKDKDVLLIGFSGQTYAEQAINTLLSSLDAMDWMINNKKVIIRFLGYHISMGGHHKRNVEYLGYRGQKETIDLLAECDLLFCPYITDPKYALVAQTSFPAKLSTYLATGVPVLFVGTKNSSPAVFLSDNDAGYICVEPTTSELVEELDRIFANEKLYEKSSHNGLLAFEKYLTNENQKDLFAKFLKFAGD